MTHRVITGVILILLTGIFLWVPPFHWMFTLFIITLTTIASWEYINLISPYRLDILYIASLFLVPIIGLFGSSLLNTSKEIQINFMLILSFGILALLYIFSNTSLTHTLVHSCFTVFYFGWVPAHLLILHSTEGGSGWITLFIVSVALCDSGAYIIGKSLGKKPLAPAISPNKTWEGSIGGVIFSIIGMWMMWAIAHYLPWKVLPQENIFFYTKWGIILSILSQFGDLLESRWKREAGTKDAGNIFPGHGGVLDRCDGMLFTLPFFYYLRTII